jgi:hypothetical protein
MTTVRWHDLEIEVDLSTESAGGSVLDKREQELLEAECRRVHGVGMAEYLRQKEKGADT